jgi:hypothetical protein
VNDITEKEWCLLSLLQAMDMYFKNKESKKKENMEIYLAQAYQEILRLRILNSVKCDIIPMYKGMEYGYKNNYITKN